MLSTVTKFTSVQLEGQETPAPRSSPEGMGAGPATCCVWHFVPLPFGPQHTMVPEGKGCGPVSNGIRAQSKKSVLSLSSSLIHPFSSTRFPPRLAEPHTHMPPGVPHPPCMCVPSVQDVGPCLIECANSFHPLRPGPLPTHSYASLIKVSSSFPPPTLTGPPDTLLRTA